MTLYVYRKVFPMEIVYYVVILQFLYYELPKKILTSPSWLPLSPFSTSFVALIMALL